MLLLPDVTLLSATSVDLQKAVYSLQVSGENIQFGAVKLLSPERPDILPSSIEHVVIPNIDFYGYSKFMIEELFRYVDTPYCLVTQADGFVVNVNKWRNDFLEYDYIGAPWPAILGSSAGNVDLDKNRVGNGGFSLRSQRFLEASSKIFFDDMHVPIKSEDFLLCHYLFDQMVADGIRFAPLELARQFAVEAQIDQNHHLNETFGFHGKGWLTEARFQDILSRSQLKNEITSLLV